MLFPEKAHLLYQKMEANSVHKAWYEIRIEQHVGGGFLIIKKSGSEGSKGTSEMWFRWTLSDAVIKFYKITEKKLQKRKGRIYIPSLC